MAFSPTFRSLYAHGFVRVAAAVPKLRVAEPAFNVQQSIGQAAKAAEHGAALIAFPELGLSAYSNEDLFHQQALQDAVTAAIAELVAASAELLPVIVAGAPLMVEGALFNTAVVIHRGRVLGVMPKSYLPEYREYYEKRQFRAARDAAADQRAARGGGGPVRLRAAVRVLRCRRLHAPGRDLRGRLGADSAQHLWRAWPEPR